MAGRTARSPWCVLPIALTGLVLAWDRLVRRRRAPAAPPAKPAAVLGLAVLGTLSHPLLDFMNSFGIRLLMPFSGRWFYGDALYIVDPWLYVILGTRRAAGRAALAAARRRRAVGAPGAGRRGRLYRGDVRAPVCGRGRRCTPGSRGPDRATRRSW